MVTANIDFAPLLKKLKQVPREAARIMRKVVEVDAKGFVKDVVAITPPSKGKANTESKRRGEMSITADLLGLKNGRGKHQRTAGVFVVMDDKLLAANAEQAKNGKTVRLFATKDGKVYGCDRHFFKPRASIAEMFAHHQSMRGKNGKVRTAGGATRDIGRWKFIDQMVVGRRAYLRYEKWIHKRVGLLAAGFLPAARRLGVKLPKWISRHTDAPGTVHVSSGGIDRYAIIISNKARYGNATDLPRRMKFVMESTKRKKRAQNALKFEIRAALKAAKMQTV